MFFSSMVLAAKQVVVLYILVAVGFIADKTGVFKESTARLSNNLLFYIITPSVIINSFLSMEFSPENASAFATAFACALGTFLAGALLGLPFFNKTGDRAAIYKFAVTYGNMGYMALPLANAVIGAEGVFYCSAGVVAFNIICFTHGVWLMSEGDGSKKKFELKRIILNPGVISVIIGLPLFAFGIKLPSVLSTPLDCLSAMNTPLAMIFFGTYIANTKFSEIVREKENYLVALLKLVVLPLAMSGIYRLVGMSGALLTACVISAASPSANNTVMFSAKYGRDTAVASKVVAFDSFVSILTLPVMIALSKL